MKPTSQHSLIVIDRDYLLYFLVLVNSFPLFTLMMMSNSHKTTLDPSGNVTWQIFWVLAFLDATFIAISFRIPLHKIALAIAPFSLILLWLMLSTLWSEHPDLTIRRGLRECLELTTVILLALTFSKPLRLLQIMFVSFFCVMCLDFVSIAFPAVSFTPIGFAGVHGHKSSAGEFYFLAIPVFLMATIDYRIARSRLIGLIATTPAVVFLLLTRSKSAAGMLMLTFLALILLKVAHSARKYLVPLTLMFILSAFVAVAIVWTIGIQETFDLIFGDPTLTNRALIWRYLFARYETSPIWGAGYGAIWQVGPEVETYFKELGFGWVLMNEGHNGYIDILAQLGLIGLLLFLVFLSFYLLKVLLMLKTAGWASLDAYAAYLFIGGIGYNITESSYFRSGSILWLLTVLTITAVPGHFIGWRRSLPSSLFDRRNIRVGVPTH